MTKSSSKTSARRPRFNLDEQPVASDTLDIRKQAEYVLTRKQQTLASKKVNWAKLRQIIINR